MLFNSLQFFIFFVIVYSLYLCLNHKWQNRMLLVASCIFYGSWDWRFLSLIFISTTIDYFCGIKISQSDAPRRRKRFLLLSIVSNLSILGFFKYFNFFVSNLQTFLKSFGFPINPHFLHIILPVGISFYTFEAMSYTIDVYRNKMKPTQKFLDYVLFVIYFPHLVAGPIMKAKDLLPQVISPRKLSLDQFYEGCYLIFWGIFQKIFIADNLAKIVDPIFASEPPYNGWDVLLALYAFAFQILCDFSGYSNIARGLGKCMGFDIMINFNLPYFATNPREFWQRWHISLSTFLRDYLYIPLGGNQKGTFNTYRNLVITMLLGGLWHGAQWTFVVWGAYQGMLLVIQRFLMPLWEKMPSLPNILMRRIWFLIRVIFFFHLVCLGWLSFRAQSLSQVCLMLQALLFNFQFGPETSFTIFQIVFFTWILMIVQSAQFLTNDLMCVFKANPVIKTLFYVICYYLVTIYGVASGKEFIYFQF